MSSASARLQTPINRTTLFSEPCARVQIYGLQINMRLNASNHLRFSDVVRLLRGRLDLLLPGSVLMCAILILIVHSSKPRIWKTNEVPVAFWSWRTITPSANDVDAAIRDARMQILFLHAGQIDSQDKKLRRIRPVEGAIPRGIPVHLVYNATREFLRGFERLSPVDVSSAVVSAFSQDSDRARGDQAEIAGLQLDFDVPTRLLPNYGAILRKIREQLPAGIQLSITGLPTWLGSGGLREPLSVCDFWIPQCYGAYIPERADQRIPITSVDFVGTAVGMARELGVAFYAGLAGYGYGIHYSREGSLIGLRGDLDPQAVVANDEFELVEQQPFLLSGDRNLQAGEWRSRYRARRDLIVDGTAIRAGESVLLDRPTSVGLRECARKVRELGGRKLLGICLFRIPTEEDSANLTLPEIASAINDLDPRYAFEARGTKSATNGRDGPTILTLEFWNSGSTSSRFGGEALNLIVPLPPGSVVSLAVDGQATADLVFKSDRNVLPCNLKRANAVRVIRTSWPPGSRLRLTIEVNGSSIDELTAIYSSALDDGSTTSGSNRITVARHTK